MDVTRLKDAAAAVSRICGRGSPIPIFAQVRGILTIWAHRCAAAVWSAHRRAFTAVGSRPPDPDRPHGGHLSLTARARCAQHGPTPSSPPRLPAASQLSIYPHIPATPGLSMSPRCLLDRRHTPTGRACPPTPRPLPHPGRPHLHVEPSSSPSAFRPAANADGDIPRGRARLSAAGGIRRRRGQQSRPRARETPPAGRKCPRTRRMSPGMPASSR